MFDCESCELRYPEPRPRERALGAHSRQLLARMGRSMHVAERPEQSFLQAKPLGSDAQIVTAPWLLADTHLAYLARTPVAGFTTGFQSALRRDNSSSDTCNCSNCRCASIVMRSPSCTRAMVPPAAASGEIWPTTMP